jgi:hypothetical protein
VLRYCGINIGFSNEIIGFVAKCLFNDRFPPGEVEKGSVGMVQNVRIPEGFVNILVKSNANHNFKLNSYEF